MAEKKQQPQSEPATRFVVYPGPHEHVTLKFVEGLSDVHLERGKSIELPTKIANDLIARKKVKPARPAAAPQSEPADQSE
jgi:hypothetical protein